MLTTRERLKGGGDACIGSARAAGLPVFSMRSGSSASIIKALRSLAGIDPSPLSLRDASAAVRGAFWGERLLPFDQCWRRPALILIL